MTVTERNSIQQSNKSFPSGYSKLKKKKNLPSIIFLGAGTIQRNPFRGWQKKQTNRSLRNRVLHIVNIDERRTNGIDFQ